MKLFIEWTDDWGNTHSTVLDAKSGASAWGSCGDDSGFSVDVVDDDKWATIEEGLASGDREGFAWGEDDNITKSDYVRQVIEGAIEPT